MSRLPGASPGALPACLRRPETHVRDAYDSDYWLHLEMEGSEPLSRLDAYLRHIWLEYCGHLREFSIGRRGWDRDVDMARPASQIFRPGVELTHVYDFGTSTVTATCAASPWASESRPRPACRGRPAP